MPDFLRVGSGTWFGDLQSGQGTASTESGVLENAHITFNSRFENGGGSNPEELIAAAHASCFSMALSAGLSRQGHPPTEIRTNATLTLHKGETGFKITKIHLDTAGVVPGIDQATFEQAAETAKKTCPVSVLLTPGLQEVSLTATLAS